MLKYIVRRVLLTIPVLFGLSIVLFAFVHLLPGDPTRAILGQHATPELVARLRESLGLDKPLWEQYVLYIGQLLRGDLGVSIVTGAAVSSEFVARFPGTVGLTIAALIFPVGFGIPPGRIPGNSIFISPSLYPQSLIRFFARSTIFTGSPISSTNTSPPAASVPA